MSKLTNNELEQKKKAIYDSFKKHNANYILIGLQKKLNMISDSEYEEKIKKFDEECEEKYKKLQG